MSFLLNFIIIRSPFLAKTIIMNFTSRPLPAVLYHVKFDCNVGFNSANLILSKQLTITFIATRGASALSTGTQLQKSTVCLARERCAACVGILRA